MYTQDEVMANIYVSVNANGTIKTAQAVQNAYNAGLIDLIDARYYMEYISSYYCGTNFSHFALK